MVYEKIKDPNLRRRRSLTDFSFTKVKERKTVGMGVRLAAYGAELAAAANFGADAHFKHKPKKSEGCETHVNEGEILFGRGWGHEPSEVTLPSMFAPQNEFNQYKVNK